MPPGESRAQRLVRALRDRGRENPGHSAATGASGNGFALAERYLLAFGEESHE